MIQWYDIIQWCNANQGFAQVALTVVYVVATLVIVLMMRSANRLTSRSLRQAVELENRRSRPYVLFDIVFKGFLVRAVLRNDGLTAACNVALTVTPRLTRTDDGKEVETPLTLGPIKHLAPHREFSDIIDSGPEFFKRYPDARFTGELSYCDLDGVRYVDPFDLDLAFVKGLVFTSEGDIPKELEKIAGHLDQIARAIGKR